MLHGEAHGEAVHETHQTDTGATATTKRMFAKDPFGQARKALCDTAHEVAKVGARTPAEYRSRAVAVAELVVAGSRDDDVRDAASDDALNGLQLLSETPAETVHDLACKLAVLVQQMAINAVDPCSLPRANFTLAASALADAVLLQAGPLALPAECRAPVATPADIEFWRQVAIRQDIERNRPSPEGDKA